GELAGAVLGQERRAGLTGLGGRVGDHALVVRPLPAPHRRAVREEDALGVHVHVGVPLFFGEIDHPVHRGDAGVGADDVEPAEGRDRRVEHAVGFVPVGHVEPLRDGPAAHLRGNLVRRLPVHVGVSGPRATLPTPPPPPPAHPPPPPPPPRPLPPPPPLPAPLNPPSDPSPGTFPHTRRRRVNSCHAPAPCGRGLGAGSARASAPENPRARR